MIKLLIALLTLNVSQAAVQPISTLPLATGASTGANDSFPFVDAVALSTKRMKLSEIPTIPAVAAAIAAAGSGTPFAVSSISSSVTLSAGSPVNFRHIACNASAGNVVATLPLCSGNVGQIFNLKKVDSSSNSCSFARAGADLIDGQTSLTTSIQYNAVLIVCRAAGFYDIL